MSSINLGILLNSGEKLHQCLLCGKAFTQPLGLSMLMRICTGEKPCLCDECGKAFIHSSAFTRHVKIRTGEKPFVSKECRKAFSQSLKVTKHWKIDCGENPQAVRQVGRPSVCPHNLLGIWKFSVERNLINVKDEEGLHSVLRLYCASEDSHWREALYM